MCLTTFQFSVNLFSGSWSSLFGTLGYTHSFQIHIHDLQEHDPA